MKAIFLIIQLFWLLNIAYAQTFFDSHEYKADLSTLKIYPENRIKIVFDPLVIKSGIQFGYPQGGCQQRAEIMHQLLQNNNHIDHDRIWAFSAADFVSSDSSQLEIKDQSP